MPWDSDKSTAADPDNPTADEQLTADEWDNHVNEGHWNSDELNLSTNADGDPILTDPQNGDQTVLRYNRSKGAWVVDALEAGSVNTDQATVKELAAVMELTTDKSVANSTVTTVPFDNVVFEDTAVVDADPTTGKITVQQDGGYIISSMVLWGADPDWNVSNKSEYRIDAPSLELRDRTRKQSDDAESRYLPAKMVEMTSGETITPEVFHTAGAAAAIKGDPANTYITVYRVRQ